MLAVPPQYWSWDLNRDWLYEAAVIRGDIIRITSDPSDPRTIWKDGIVDGIKTVTGREIEFLESYGFVYDPSIPGYRQP